MVCRGKEGIKKKPICPFKVRLMHETVKSPSFYSHILEHPWTAVFKYKQIKCLLLVHFAYYRTTISTEWHRICRQRESASPPRHDIYLLTLHISMLCASNQRSGWSSLVVTQPSTDHQLMCVQCVCVRVYCFVWHLL